MSTDTPLSSVRQPLSQEDFLRWMNTDLPGLYLIGSFNRHITVHSQQRRAINLVWSLMRSCEGLDGKSIAIVGAGFAGLTAAAFTLDKSTAKVTLFDAASRPLWLQDACANRWLHPGIYDWPLPGSLEPRTALPVLNWRAGKACDVATQVGLQWKRIAATEGRLTERFETRVESVTQADSNKLMLGLSNGERTLFDIVLLAVGFGIERGGKGRVAYWNDADGLDGIDVGSTVLIAGFGDGGLADVMRLCLPDIRQDNLVELVRHVPARVQQDLINAEERYQSDGTRLDEFYGNLKVDSIIRQLKEAAPPLARVTLTGRKHLYDPRSAILNRFLVSQLLKARGSDAFELIYREIDESSLSDLPTGGHRVQFRDGEDAREFDHLMIRFGPEPSFKSIVPLANSPVSNERRKHWYDFPLSLDRTRVPLWENSGDSAESEGWPDYLAYESSSRRWCLILHPQNSKIDWRVHTRNALESAGNCVADLNVQPLVLSSDAAIVDNMAIRNSVRALCAADVVIADVTDYDPVVMFLLGVRAAVRRGVTIACTQHEHSVKIWDNLPFNLKELNLVSFYNEAEGYKELSANIRAGLAQSRDLRRYLDLPVYDYVRETPADGTAGSKQVLFLRAFTSYGGERLVHVVNRIRKAFSLAESATVESIIDQKSPRLSGQRLYEAIRHWKTCVVDLTWWRPNVLFELGVRLAVSHFETYCLIDPSIEGSGTFEGARSNLTRFLRPFHYDLDTPSFSFPEPTADSKLVYESASRNFRTSQDQFGEQVDAMLIAAADVTPGHDDPLQAVEIKPLYARDNRPYGEEVRYSVFERLCAAWYYLRFRDEPHTFRPIDLLDQRKLKVFRSFQRLGSRLKVALAHRYGWRDEGLRRYIEESEQIARDSGSTSLMGLLDEWVSLKGDPPWHFDAKSTTREDIEDMTSKLASLNALENRLNGLASPVCQLPLQGVQSDRRRLELALENLQGIVG